MAAAAAPAPRVFFQYAHPGGAVADAHAVFDARGAMDLHVTSDADIAEFDSLIPADLAVKRLGGGRAAVTYGDMAKIVFPLLDIAPEVAPLTVGASFFSVEAWSRWWDVLHSFMASRRGRQDEYPAYMHAALVARAAATDAQRAALTVVPTDLEATEDTRPGAADGAAAPVDNRGFFMHLTYGSLRSQHGLMSLARLIHGLGCHAAHCARAGTGFRRGMSVLAQFAAAVTGLPAADMEPQEAADVLATELNAIAWGTEFEHLGSHLSDVKWSQLRLELTLGRPEEWSKAATRARLLSERFHGVVGMPRFKAVAAVVRGTEAAAGRSLTSPGACALAEEIAVRAGVLRPGEPFTSDVLAMLTSKVGHMTEALLAQPWVSRTPRERAEHVVELLRNSEANLAAADALRHQIGDPIVSKDKSELRGQGTIPKHFQAHVGPAMMSGPYRDLKAAALARLAQGDPAAELDALQTISTGVIVQPDGTILPRQWSALAMMIADGPKHGVNAELFDEEAAVLTSIARRRSAELLGRTIGLQFAIDKLTLHEHLEGYQASTLDEALSKEDWSGVDFGHAYRSARAALRVQPPPAPSPATAYASLADVEDALRIAGPVLALKGFPGGGAGTFPFALHQVCETWKLYGGEGASDMTKQKLAEQGREYLVAFLAHMGQARHTALSGKNPAARSMDQQPPPHAHAAFQRHCARLEGALALGGYIAYTDAGSSSTAQASGATKPKAKPAHDTGNESRVVVKVDWQGGEGTAQVTGPGGRSSIVSLPLLLERAVAGRQACVAGLIGAAWGKSYEAALCQRRNCGGRKHAWKEGACSLKKCEVSSGKKRAPTLAEDDTGPRKRAKKEEVKTKPGKGKRAARASEDSDHDEDDADDEGAAAGESADAETPSQPSRAGAVASDKVGPDKGQRGGGKGGRGRAEAAKGGAPGQGARAREASAALAAEGVVLATVPAPTIQMKPEPAPLADARVTHRSPASAGTEAVAGVNTTAASSGRRSASEPAVTRRASAMRTPNVPVARSAAASGRSTQHRVWVRASTAFAATTAHGHSIGASVKHADGPACPELLGAGGAQVLRSALMVAALMATPQAPKTLAVGDRRGRMRDASNAAGWPALACDLLPCESEAPGFSYLGSGTDLDGVVVWDRLFTNMPCEQQSVSLGARMAATKALDGRMWWGQAAWLRMWCIRAACAVAEQPDTYIADFYDAPYVRTSPAEWGGQRQKTTLLFYRGTGPPSPPFPGRRGSVAWHDEGRGRSREDVAFLRDDLGPEIAAGLASQICPNGESPLSLQYATEVERLAAAWWSVGLPLPADYNNAAGTPVNVDDCVYATCRGEGDGRRLSVATTQPGLLAYPARWPGVSIPRVTERARALGQRAAALRAEEAGQALARSGMSSMVPVLPEGATGDRVRVVPVHGDGIRLWFLLPAGGGTVGATFSDAAGLNATQRKRTTAGATAMAGLLYPVDDGKSSQPAVRCAPAAFAGTQGDGEAVCVAFVPPELVGSPAEKEAGLVWRMRALPREPGVMGVLAVVRWYVFGWQRPQRELAALWRTGAVGPARTERGQQQPAESLRPRVMDAKLARDLACLQEHLRTTAADAHCSTAVADMLASWAEKAGEQRAASTRPPESVLQCSLRPDTRRLWATLFVHRCRIPATKAVAPTWQRPTWPPGVPRPSNFLHTFRPTYRGEVQAQIERLRVWNADRAAGGTMRRPEARSWSDAARLPWLQGWVQDFRGGVCVPLDPRGTAAPRRVHAAAALWYWREYPHRKLLSFLVHGVMLQAQDEIPLQTTLAPPLFALYTVAGGADAVVNELHTLEHERGWYISGALPLTSPVRCTPRSATERVGGPPRGLAEQGWPRKLHVTVDNAEVVESLNVTTGKRRAAAAGDTFYPFDESKPRLRDACVNAMILWVPAQMLGLSLILITFDYKYFFHHFVYAMRDVWKLAFELPGRAPQGGADGDVIRFLHELVMSMGWTRASLIAQELADAIIWKLLRLVDVAIAGYVTDLRRTCQEFDNWWCTRATLPESDYGTQARLHDSLQYTDDKFGVCVGPVVAAHFLVCFARLIGPAYVPHDDPAMSARATAARAAQRAGVHAIPARPVSLPYTQVAEVVVLHRGQPAPVGFIVENVGRSTPLGNPYKSASSDGGGLARSVEGFACLCASGKRATAVEVGALLGLTTDLRQGALCDAALQPTLQRLVESVVQGGRLAVRCDCPAAREVAHSCHAAMVAEVVRARAQLAVEAARGPPPDPVMCDDPAPAYGLNLEPAKPAKWSISGAAIWIGKGLDVNNLVVWIPEHKSAHALLDIQSVLDGLCTVARYEHLVGYLEDLVEAVGGGHYRMKGMRAPLQPGSEADDGPSAIVRLRTQMRGRLLAWRKALLNCPGASMLTMLGVSPPRSSDAVIWEIGGDAALEGRDEVHKLGLGAFWYGIYWMVPLSAVPGMSDLHIICLELLELGLGVVLVGPLLCGAARVRLVSDALVAVRTVQVELLDGRRVREAKAHALIAIHECLIHRPEWRELHATVGEVTATHSYGERMLLHDAASRQYEGVIRDVCAAMKVSPRKLDPIPDRGMRFLEEAVAAARSSMRADPEVDRGPYAYGVEAIEHVPRCGRQIVAKILGLRAESAAEDSRRPGAVCAQPCPSAAPSNLQMRRSSLRPDLRSARAVPAVVVHSEDTGGPVARRRHEDGVAASEMARAHASALRQLAAGAWPGIGGGKARPVPNIGVSQRAAVQARLMASPSVITEARTAIQGARVAAAAAKVPLLAAVVVSDGLDSVRVALVERSLRDARSDEDGLGVRGASDELLKGLLGAAMRAMDRRFADSTRALDKSYWRFWCEWCDMIGTPPLRTNVAANTGAIPHLHRREVAIALGGFMSFVAENCPRFKVSSMLARLRGVARRHAAHGLKFVSLSAVVMAADGLVQEHIDVHGADSLLPASKEPLQAAEIIAVLSLEDSMPGRAVGGVLVGRNVDWQGVRVLVALLATMGCRKEAIALGPREVPGPRKLMLHHVTYRFDFVLVRSPSLEQLVGALQGSFADVMVYVHPVPCKNDPTNQKFGNSPVPSRLRMSRPINLARELIQYEIMRKVEPSRRKESPLVLSPSGQMWRKKELDGFFKQLFSTVVEPARLARISVHSFRVYLACALLASGATPEQIMQLLRWSSDSARKLYARLGEQTQVGLLESAGDAHLDSVRSHTLLEAAPAVEPLTRDEASERQAGAAVREGEALLERALETNRVLPTAAELRRAAVVDDDDVFVAIRDNYDALRSAAARHDAREGVEVDIEEDEGEEEEA